MDHQNDLIIKVWAETTLHTLTDNELFEQSEFPYLNISKFAQKRDVSSIYYFYPYILLHANISVHRKTKIEIPESEKP